MNDADANDKQPPRQACDSCRFRKVKCDRSVPCRNCRDASLECQYRHCVRRRGPKRGSGRRLTQLRRGLSEFEKDQFHVICSPAVEEPSPVGAAHEVMISPPEEAWPSPSLARLPQLPVENITTDVEDSGFLDAPSLPLDSLSYSPSEGSAQLSLYLVAHIQVFLRYMFPTMPVIDGDAFLKDAVCINSLHPSRYALILSLCAATRTHLQLDIPENNLEGGPGANIPPTPSFTSESLLRIAEAALRQVDIIEVDNLDAVLSSYFVFAGYGGLNKIRHASFYLNQAISLAQGLQLTSEAGYAGLSATDRQLRRRAFWLLFATER
ncbi:Zn(II)2Cys6 transcription factor [Candidatus Bathyarchaeota archaeon]|nr:Zn(II)2Cys6 transcription factor [Candidatus Bathyarchaeota archaeon]